MNLEKNVFERTKDLNVATDVLIEKLALAAELRDTDTGKHVLRVGKYAELLAKLYGLPDEIAFLIRKAAPLHDVGKIGIPDSILLKPGKLDDSQRELMKKHTVLGAKMLGDHPSLLIQMAKSIALSHHEKWDGTGYPNALKGESIPIEGRITAISDVFDALYCERPYKKAWPIKEIIDFITKEAGGSFDPLLVDVFLNNQNEFVEIQQQHSD